MLAHPQVIVGTPDGNLILQTMIKGLRKVAGASLQVRKDSISIFVSDELETRLKELVEIHHFLCRLGSARNRAGRTRLLPGATGVGGSCWTITQRELRNVKSCCFCASVRSKKRSVTSSASPLWRSIALSNVSDA